MAASCSRSRNSRWRLSMPSRTSSRIFSDTSSSASCARAHSVTSVQTRRDVGRLEQLPLLLGGQVRRVAGHVGELGRVGDPLHGVDDLPGVALLEDRDHQALVLGGLLAVVLGGFGLVDQFGLDPQRRAGSGHAGPDAGAGVGAQDGGRLAAGQPAHLLDGRDGAVGRVAVRQPGGDQQLAVGAGAGGLDRGASGVVQLDRHDHAGQDDGVGQGQHREFQLRLSHIGSRFGPGVMFPFRRRRTADLRSPGYAPSRCCCSGPGRTTLSGRPPSPDTPAA